MRPQELRERTRQFMLRVIRFCRTVPGTPEGQELGRQLIRAGMAVSGNYRSAQRARSRAESRHEWESCSRKPTNLPAGWQLRVTSV